jgi:hypothetical protein
VTYSKAISPVCLPPASTAVDQFAGKDAAILGWGILKVVGKNIQLKRVDSHNMQLKNDSSLLCIFLNMLQRNLIAIQ